MEQNRFLKLLSDYRSRGRGNNHAHVKDGENGFGFNNYNFKP
jgi:hypothetical protein